MANCTQWIVCLRYPSGTTQPTNQQQNEYGFWPAGATIANKRQGNSSVSPSLEQPIYPIEGEPGAQQDDEFEEAKDENQEHDRDELEEMAEKYEELKAKVEQYFDDTNGRTKVKVPVVQAPEKPTKDEWLRHQATHTHTHPLHPGASIA